jgi:hypothetical protein
MKPLLCAFSFCCLWLIALKSSAQSVDTAQLVVHADMPPFLHEGDRMEITVHLTNKTSSEITGQAVLQLLDAANGTAVDGWFQNVFPAQYFTIESGKTAVVPFPIEVPYLFKKALAWRVTASAQHLSGSDEGLLAVLTTKALRTETLLLPIQDTGTLSFTFQNLVKSGADAEHQSLSIEALFNPHRFVIEALPHLVTVQPETTEALWYQFYGYALAAKVRATSPEWKQAFAQGTTPDTSILATLLQKNNTAASLIATETPWVVETVPAIQAQHPFLMDASALQNEITHGVARLKERQQKNGGFTWINGGPEDRYITGCIVTGMGVLKSLKALWDDSTAGINTILEPALAYLDKQLEADFTALNKTKKQGVQGINALQVQYLYLRSFFADHSIPASTLPAYQHYVRQAQRLWQSKNLLLQCMIALALHRQGDKKLAQAIMQQSKRTALKTMGSNKTAFGWWQAPAETTAQLLEAFHEITGDAQIKNTLISGLLQQKEKDAWQTGKATAHACYALLLMPVPTAGNAPLLQVQFGDTHYSNSNKNTGQQGYFRQGIYPPLLQPNSGKIQVTVQPAASASGKSHFWITASWRYFAEQNAIATSPRVAIQKKLFLKSGSSKYTKQDNNFHVGDTIQVQLTLTTDRSLEYIHIKDVHAAAMKPVSGAATYQTEAATHFYLPAVSKGTTVLRYAIVATRAGTFSTGLATVESGHTSNLLAQHNAVRIQIE